MEQKPILRDKEIEDLKKLFKENEVLFIKGASGVGKTTLIEIIHFCLGARVGKGSIFRNENLKGWSFTIDIEIKKSLFLEFNFISYTFDI
jgi:ABC-type lipoprotein export system ATPase subunit